ncbi:MAG: HDOD domain-containing protein [Terracidiphilus sp.]|jgi:EAL and modified HD-GYP domain-containing signal transduction protein
MATATNNHLRFIGRQAILDEKMQIYGHEILFRSGTDNYFSGDGEHATNHAIDSCLSMIACSSTPNLFINCTRESLVNGSVKVLPSRSVILEILETVPSDAEVIKALKKLKQSGFRIALDDFSPDPSRDELVQMADFVKVDFRSSNLETRQEIYNMCRNKKTSFVAEKVETLSEVQTAQVEGNTFFQGYFHSRPEIIAESQISANKLTYLQMFAVLAHPSPDFREIERLLLLEPSLCYRLLRLANSALYGFRYRISTIQAALVAVGEDAFRKLVSIILAGKLAHTASDYDVRQALERAHFCESMASALKENPAELYMLGMLSMMDRMLNIPMKKLLDLIYLSSRLEEALLGNESGIGRALEICKYHERGGDGKGPPHSDPLVRDSAANYFEALLAAGNTLHAMRP